MTLKLLSFFPSVLLIIYGLFQFSQHGYTAMMALIVGISFINLLLTFYIHKLKKQSTAE